MLLDRYNRKIEYLRISVTDRCNHRCIYCMPQTPFVLKDHSDILSFEQIEGFTRSAVALGIKKVRLTGGEPLVRRKIVSLITKLSAIKGLDEVCMTTNGCLLTEMADDLKSAGLTRLNISIDSVDPVKYSQLTRCGNLQDALDGVTAAIEAGFQSTKINMVILSDTTQDEIEKMEAFCKDKGLQLQKIMQFSLYDRDDLSSRFHTERPPKCLNCNRLRLTSDGFLKPCLFSDDEIAVDFDNIEASILKAVSSKPENGSSCNSRKMNQIGG